MEILGCGIVNPAVLANGNINNNYYSGLAFGLGIERIAMLKYGVTDIRDFINLTQIFIAVLTKIFFPHLKKFLNDNTDINTVSNLLFQLGHENEIDSNILDIEFTPNKGDCLSLMGIARDLNAITKTNLTFDIYSGEIDALNFNFVNDLPDFCPSIIFKN